MVLTGHHQTPKGSVGGGLQRERRITAVLPIPSFRDGCEVQAVMEAVLRSDEQKTWVNVPVID